MKRLGLLAAAAIVAVATSAMAAQRAVHAPSAEHARIELGRRLFYDADLSRDGTMACATCHEQHHGFADGNRTHPGVTDEAGRRNVLGLANVGQFTRLTWADLRQTSLAKQAAVPVFGTHPVEMGMQGMAAEIPKRLGRDPCYIQMFTAAFPKSDKRITFDKVATALASFEKTLVSRDTPFDRGRLSPTAKAGFALFRQHCASCHSGRNFTDMAYHRLGVMDPSADDQGLFEVTHRPADRQSYRTPSLRNVAVTAPYWHDGSAPTIFAAVTRHGLAIPMDAIPEIETFLRSLTDQAFLHDARFSLPKSACGKAL
jgi:cytochrome c peroxidase